MKRSFSLCPACDACAAVEIDQREVRIGEEGNPVKLKLVEWNVLVQLIKAGEPRVSWKAHLLPPQVIRESVCWVVDPTRARYRTSPHCQEVATRAY